MKNFHKFLVCAALISCSVFAISCDGDEITETITTEETNLLKPAIVEIELISQTISSASVAITPDENTVEFIYAIGEESDLSAFQAGTLSSIIRVEGNSQLTHTFEDLESNKNYMVFAAGYDNEGTLHGTQTVVISIEETSTYISITTRFIAADVAALTLHLSQNYLLYMYDLYKGTEAIEENKISFGSSQETFKYVHTMFDLEPEQDYLFVVTGRTRWGEEHVMEKQFTTKNADDVPAVDFEITDMDVVIGSYKITPSNNLTSAVAVLFQTPDKYLSTIMDKSIWYGDYAGMISTWGESGIYDSFYSSNGTIEVQVANATIGSDIALEMYAVAYDANNEPANVQKFSYSTPAVDPTAATATMSINVINITATSAEYEFLPDANTLGFYVETFEEGWFENWVLPNVTASDPYYVHNLLASYGTDYMIYTKLPYSNWVDTSLFDSWNFYVVAAPFNVNGPVDAGWGDLYYYKFSTPAAS